MSRGRRRRAAAAAATAWLGLLGLIATVIGGHDAVAGGEINVRLWGTLVLGAGILLLAGAVGLRHDRPQGRSLATLSAVLGMLLGAITFLAQVVNDEPDSRLLLWGAIVVLSGATAWTVWKLSPAEERNQGIWRQLPILKSVVSVGVAFSVAQFWYGSIYVPTTAPASLTVNASVEEIVPGKDRLTMRGSVVIRNTSSTRVNVLASLLEVSGEPVEPQTLSRKDFGDQIRDTYENNDTTGSATRYAASSNATTLTRGRLLPDATYFEPDETLTVPFVAWAPPGEFALVNVDAVLAVARGRVLALETGKTRTTFGAGRVVSHTAVPEAGWLRSLTRGDRWVRAEYTTDIDIPSVGVTFVSDPASDVAEDFDSRMKRFYGYALVQASALDPLPGPPAEQGEK